MKYFILFAIFYHFTAQAWIIGNEAKPTGEDAVCRILYRNQEGALTSICSGTLIDSKRIITAGHCISTTDKPSVECGYAGVEGEQKIELTGGGSRVVTGGAKFKEIRTDVLPKIEASADPSDSDSDIGIIELRTEISSITPASFNTSARTEFFDEESGESKIKADTECKIEGFGIGNDGDSGKLNSGPLNGEISLFDNAIVSESTVLMSEVNTEQVQLIDSCVQTYQDEMIPKNFIPLAKLFAANKVFESGVTHGDSGGPLLCRKKGSPNWTIVGIASKAGYGKADVLKAESRAEWHLFSQEDWDVLVDGKVRPERPKLIDPFEELMDLKLKDKKKN